MKEKVLEQQNSIQQLDTISANSKKIHELDRKLKDQKEFLRKLSTLNS